MEPVDLFIVGIGKRIVTISIPPIQFQYFRVKDLKQKVKEKEGIALDAQRLFFDGKQLEDEMPLLNYDVRRRSTIHLVLCCPQRPLDAAEDDLVFLFCQGVGSSLRQRNSRA
eukprot:gnl/MRDRNA2_/MRDRNA2_250236_c0_seq1.p2 gnl/MRDRNA2_/MRDRNA2_250236_c0~~gnl/MRDRNA2_/MRDRNA2_250236_c0_seq1.p2  ORF type:complete len:112 (+),score=11.79 gnl/MRDRNA2_/MRDRNA2_250236_c0_seq1:98-433(+)